MVDVLSLPKGAFGYVPTPALVAPLEFTLRRDDFLALGGHGEAVLTMDQVMQTGVSVQLPHGLHHGLENAGDRALCTSACGWAVALAARAD